MTSNLPKIRNNFNPRKRENIGNLNPRKNKRNAIKTMFQNSPVADK